MAASLKRMFLAAAATLLLTGPAWAQVSYRWVDDASGEYVYSPTPPDDEDQPYVMMRNGLIVETYEGLERLERPADGSGTPEDRERDRARREAEKQRKADALLLLQYRTFGYGHSFGVLSHYYGREAGLELREDIDTVLEPGMVVSIEPMLWIPEGQPGAGGYREHDILVIGEDGAENITGYPYGPGFNVVA